VHTVFSTKDRRPFLRDKGLREEMHCYLGGILANLNAWLIALDQDQGCELAGVQLAERIWNLLARIIRSSRMRNDTLPIRRTIIEGFRFRTNFGRSSSGMRSPTMSDTIGIDPTLSELLSFLGTPTQGRSLSRPTLV
jgi:hypothetical protein